MGEELGTAIDIKSLSVSYGQKKALDDVSLEVRKNAVTAIIGPSGCGKSTLLRALNRMNDFVPNLKTEGKVFFGGKNIYSKKIDPVLLRANIGMVFQKPNPFPRSIYKNISWGPKINGFKGNMDELVRDSLKKAAIWDEVSDRLHESALNLSGGQQQRVCIARALAMSPDVILMDEPCSALDPRSTHRIENLIQDLKKNYTIVIVTHNMQQASRISKYVAFLCDGELVEFGKTADIFTRPENKKTQNYITGRFG